MTELRKPSKTPPEASEEELGEVLSRWNEYAMTDAVAASIERLGKKLLQGFVRSWDVAGFTGLLDQNTAEKLGSDLAGCIKPTLILGYFIGWDLASGKLARSDGERYLLGATRPIDHTFNGMLEALLEGGLIDAEKCLALRSEMTTSIVECTNEISMVAIEDYHRMNTG